MRYLSALNEASGGETAGAHSHSHSHGVSTAVSSSEKETDGLRMRSGGKAVDSVVADGADPSPPRLLASLQTSPSLLTICWLPLRCSDSSTKGEAVEVNPSLQLGAYLNLFADFTHNVRPFTSFVTALDLSLSASFRYIHLAFLSVVDDLASRESRC
jgi:hypothetical protein